MSYDRNNGLSDAIAEEVFNHNDFSSSVESVIDDYDINDKVNDAVNDALKDYDFGVSDLSDRVDTLENKIGSVDNVAHGALDRANLLENEVGELLKAINELTKRIDQLEAATASVDWDELLNL